MQRATSGIRINIFIILSVTSINSGQIDVSLIDLAPSAYDMIVASVPSPSVNSTAYKPSDKLSELSSASKAAWQKSKSTNASNKSPSTLSARGQSRQVMPLPNESFVLLQDSVVRNIPSPTQPSRERNVSKSANAQENSSNHPARAVEDHTNPSPLSHHLRSTARLFNLLSSRTEIDHPLCAECTQILLTSLQRQLDETKKERDGYIAFEKEVRKEKERESQGFSREDTEKKIEKLKSEEELLIQQLNEAEKEQEQLELELHQMEADESALEQEEAEFVSPLPISLRH